MTKRDWEKANKTDAVRARGATRADITRFSAVPPTDALISQLVASGYSGRRPATAAETRRLLTEWAPNWSRISPSAMRAARKRREEAAALVPKLRAGYEREMSRLEANKRMKPKGREKARRHVDREYRLFAAELHRLSGGPQPLDK
jgi:hypothetical protein